MKINTHKKQGFTLVELLVVIAIIAILAGVGVPALMKKKKEGDRAEAIMNAKQVGLALFGFDGEWGSYPDDSTGEDIKEDLESDLSFGSSSSNDYFRQLIATGYIDQEKPFFARSSYITKKGDNNMKGAEALAAGECGFAYFMGQGGEGLGSSGNSGRPVIAAAVVEGDTSGTFEQDVYNQKAVVLRVDTSATIETIRPSDGKVALGGGKTLMDTGDDTVWGDLTPVIKPPLVD